jgi:hypothetical protein
MSNVYCTSSLGAGTPYEKSSGVGRLLWYRPDNSSAPEREKIVHLSIFFFSYIDPDTRTDALSPFQKALVRPCALLFLEPIVLLISIWMAILYLP